MRKFEETSIRDAAVELRGITSGMLALADRLQGDGQKAAASEVYDLWAAVTELSVQLEEIQKTWTTKLKRVQQKAENAA